MTDRSMPRRHPLFALAVLAGLVGYGEPAAAAPDTPDDARCAGLVGSRFASVPDAPTQIISASTRAASGDQPALCEVKGYVTPQVAFVVQLPLAGWNGKLMVMGCGGFCGSYENSINFPLRDEALRLKSAQEGLRRGYAVTASNMGHYSTPRDAKWAYNDYTAQVDFAWRATHVNTVAAKAIIQDFYGRPQNYAYFQGCSTGGRQGTMSAQRHPEDFDGIIAGAGVIHFSTSGFQLIWSGTANLDAEGKQIMNERDVRLLHATVMQSCDAIDGQRDGILDDPRRCNVDLAALQCREGGPAACLTPAKLEVARKIYQGPRNSRGQPIHVGASTYGSELNWLGQYVDSEQSPAIFVSWSEDRFRYLDFFEDPGPRWTYRDVDYDRDPPRVRGNSLIYDAVNPDLRRFKANGGKMIAFSGWADQQVVPANFTDYYETVVRTMGGLAPTREFYRLFMMPGVGHCQGGPGADTVDYLTYLENWVEKGEAPESMLAGHYEDGKRTFTRPLFPYPDVARFKGKGDSKDATNWKRVTQPLSP